MREPSFDRVRSIESVVEKPSVNGVPDRNDVTPDTCQLPSTRCSTGLYPLGGHPKPAIEGHLKTGQRS